MTWVKEGSPTGNHARRAQLVERVRLSIGSDWTLDDTELMGKIDGRDVTVSLTTNDDGDESYTEVEVRLLRPTPLRLFLLKDGVGQVPLSALFGWMSRLQTAWRGVRAYGRPRLDAEQLLANLPSCGLGGRESVLIHSGARLEIGRGAVDWTQDGWPPAPMLRRLLAELSAIARRVETATP